MLTNTADQRPVSLEELKAGVKLSPGQPVVLLVSGIPCSKKAGEGSRADTPAGPAGHGSTAEPDGGSGAEAADGEQGAVNGFGGLGSVARGERGEVTGAPASTASSAEGDPAPQPKPRVVLLRLKGLYFETARSFLLPQAMRGIRKLRKAYDEVPDAQVLITGHTDTLGSETYNTALSLERAESIAAFLRDGVADWLAWYGPGPSNEKRWGAREDQWMLTALPEGAKPYLDGTVTGVRDARTTEALRRFQTDEGLKADGVAGPATRQRLIERYMALEHTSLPADAGVVTHGCGEFFPEVETGARVAEQRNRRVDIFLFSGAIMPPPPGKSSSKTSTEYPAWRKQVKETLDLEESGDDGFPLHVQLHDEAYHPCLGVSFRVLPASGEEVGGTTDAEGWAYVLVPGDVSKPVRIEYPSSNAPDAPLNVATVALVDRKQESAEALQAHLQNLGFSHAGEPQRAAVLRFQAAQRLPRSGSFDDPTQAAILRAVGGGNDSVTRELQS